MNALLVADAQPATPPPRRIYHYRRRLPSPLKLPNRQVLRRPVSPSSNGLQKDHISTMASFTGVRGCASMPLRTLTADRVLDVPPPYDVVTLREAGDAFAHACAIAGTCGAGTLVWVRRYDLAEFAVVLEPEETLAQARCAFYVGMNALADALSFHAPPERPVVFDWPDAIRVDGVLIGGGRLGWPEEAPEDEIPSWLAFSGMVRTFAVHAGEPGSRPLLGALDEVGFEEIDSAEIVASFTRHLMAGFYDRDEAGVAAAAGSWLARLPREDGERFGLADNGDLLVFQGDVPEPVERRELSVALATPSWLDPATGTPWL